MKPHRFPGLSMRIAMAMVVIPGLVVLVACMIWLARVAIRDPAAAPPEPGWHCLLSVLIPASWLLITEYRAVIHRNVRSAGWIAFFGLMVSICLFLAWVDILCWGDDSWSWTEFGLHGAAMIYFAIFGGIHLAWARIIDHEKPIKDSSWDDFA